MACDLANVFMALVAVAMSVIGVITSLTAQFDVVGALKNMGHGAGKLDVLAQSVDLNFGVIVFMNAVCALLICLSMFDCVHLQKHAALHLLTSSTSLCWWRILAWLTFMVQIVMSEFFMIIVVLVCLLTYICHAGEGVVYQTQELIYAIGNTTLETGALFSPYGKPATNVSDTPVISTKDMVTHLDMQRYCADAQGAHLGKAAITFWAGCFITALSQALMAVALNGEKERVSVHESYEAGEDHGYDHVPGQGHGAAQSLTAADRYAYGHG
mmetsp:Transcript_46781/g.99998  ORF Transcript_46781/g.99998 Transcript_46781/m.99998 type:complete len:270 (+) Transcript_46781:73-882(+)